MAPSRRRSGGNPAFQVEESDYDQESQQPIQMSQMMNFTQTIPDKSQPLNIAKPSEITKLSSLNPTTRHSIISNLSRLLLFKSLNGEVIDRKKVIVEALGETLKGELRAASVASALLQEANDRLQNVFGFTTRRIPRFMEESLPQRFKDRLYLVNYAQDDGEGTHSINLHSAHVDSSVEKGVLMICLAFAFCKGNTLHKKKKKGASSGVGKNTLRWITEFDLYSLLHRVDENIPGEPPSEDGRKKKSGGRLSLNPQDLMGVGQTPDIDAMLDKFVHLDYLMKDKIEPHEGSGQESQGGEDGKVIAYAMGPRASIEIGRKQIIYFCSSILDEQPDPTMLAEVDEDEEEDVEEDEEGEEEEEVVQEEEERKPKRAKRER